MPKLPVNEYRFVHSDSYHAPPGRKGREPAPDPRTLKDPDKEFSSDETSESDVEGEPHVKRKVERDDAEDDGAAGVEPQQHAPRRPYDMV